MCIARCAASNDSFFPILLAVTGMLTASQVFNVVYLCTYLRQDGDSLFEPTYLSEKKEMTVFSVVQLTSLQNSRQLRYTLGGLDHAHTRQAF